MTRRLLVGGLLVLLMQPFLSEATAELATEEEARLVAQNWLSYIVHETGAWCDDARPAVAGRQEIVVSDTLLGWCYSIEPAGHIVVPVLKDLPPVKAYSDKYGMNAADPEGYPKLLREVLRDRVRRFIERYGSLEAAQPERGDVLLGREHRKEWDLLVLDRKAFADALGADRFAPLTEVGPLLSTAWHQSSPYNDLCPMGDGGRCVVGCVATAGAQILRYHGSPAEGYGSHCYYWDGDQSCGGSVGGGTLCADYSDSYDWENMPDDCGGGCSQDEQDALAELCYEVGVAWNMNYGHCGSGAYTANALTVFPTYFGYSSSIDRENRSNHNAASWFAIIQEEINAGRPMQYRIIGHSIVCDGWRDTGGQQYHINYGWGGSQTAWYAIDNIYGSSDPMDEYLIRRIIPPPSPWEDVTDGLPLGDTGNGMGVAWGDYDGDGDHDLYFSNAGSANALVRNDGVMGFTDVTGGPLGDTGSGAGIAWGDYDNDGDPDLYVVNTGSANRLLRNDGGGTFVDVTSGPLGDTGDGYGAAWADYNGDGDLDLYIGNSGQANKLLRNDGGGTFVDTTSGPLGDTGEARGVAWGDHDGDGDPDLYLVNRGDANKLLRNDGGGTFVDVTSGCLGNTGNGAGAAWGDYDNDGDLDLYLSNDGSANGLLENLGSDLFVDATSGPLGDTGSGTGVGWGDYDNDGDLDLYLVNDGTANKLLRNEGDGTFTDVTAEPLNDTGNGRGVAWVDYDADGDVDLYVANYGSANRLFENRQVGLRHWIQINLSGVVSNRSGIGARVRIVTGESSQIREITGGSGFLSHNSLTAEFGLDWATQVDTLEIRWPSGIVNVYGPLAVDQFTLFVESSPPSAPVGLAAEAGEVAVTLEWASSEEPQLDHYRIERDTTDAFGAEAVSFTTADTSYVDFPLLEQRDYYYRVFAAGTGGTESDPSDTVSCMPFQTPPAAPIGVSAVAGDALVDLSWGSVDVPDLDHYKIERDTTDAFGPQTVTLTAADTLYTDGPLAAREYFYRVRAVDWGELESAPSETVSCVPLETPPSRPTDLAALSGDDVISLQWDPNPEIDIAGYIVYRDTLASIDPADSLIFTGNTSHDDESAPNYKLFWYCVEAVDLGGLRSVPSDTVAGIAAPGGAVFVDWENTGYENGSYSYPWSDVQEGIDHAGEGAAVIVFPGNYAGNIVLDADMVVLGMYGAGSTSIAATSGSVVSAQAGSDSAQLLGFTLDGMSTATSAILCSSSDLLVADCVLRGANVGADVRDGACPDLKRNTFTDNYNGVTCADSAHPFLSRNVFEGNTFSHISSSGDPGPLVGGSPSDVNDFLDNAFFVVFNTGTAEIEAEYNFWSAICPDSSAWFVGPLDFVPWTDGTHTGTFTSCTGVGDGFPECYTAGYNYPNPFNPVTRIRYDVPAPGGRVDLSVYSLSGRLIRHLAAGESPPGRHVAVWDGKDDAGCDVASGVYFYRLVAPDFREERRMVLLR